LFNLNNCLNFAPVLEKSFMTDKKEHIINKAVELFAEKGFEGTSIRELAAKAEVNVAMVNYYFGSKEKLFEAMVQHKAAYMKGVLEELIKNTSLTEIEKLDRIVEIYVNKIFTNRLFHRVIHLEMMLHQRESLQDSIINIISPNSIAIKSIIESGIKKGVFRKVDPPLLLASLFGTFNQVLLSRKMCNTLLNKSPDYIPYEDPKFKKRLIDHLQDLLHTYLLKN
jgi:AcrR family transcriptional regulator